MAERIITLEEFQTTSEFEACTPKMRLFLVTLIESDFDYTLATLTAFQSKSRSQAQRFSHAVRNWPKIRVALNLYFGKTPFEILLDQVEQNLRKAKPGSLAAKDLLAQKQDLLLKTMQSVPPAPAHVAKNPVPAPAGFKVGEIVVNDGKQYTVTVVDAAGQILEVEPIEASV